MKPWVYLKKTMSVLKAAVVSAKPATTSTSTTDTEFTAEVVRVTRVLPHANADRLEVARFELKGIGETAYEVVIQKGTTKPGDLMAYFSVDCVLPTDHPEFKFLTTRLDGAGKTHYRLRAARLRGVFSQGLLVGAPAGAQFGDACAESFGVTYYRAPEPEVSGGAAVPKQPKRQPFPVYSVESLKKVPQLFEAGEPVVITEKIHGTNFRFGWVRRRILGIPCGWKFVVGSHRVIKGDGKDGYYDSDVWVQAAERMDLAKKTRDYKGYVFYGELYGYTYTGQKIQDLTYGIPPGNGPGLACFDIQHGGKWLPPFERECVLADCNLPGVPVITVTNWSDDLKVLAEGYTQVNRSGAGRNQIREGVVIEDAYAPLDGRTRRKAKYVSETYLMRNNG